MRPTLAVALWLLAQGVALPAAAADDWRRGVRALELGREEQAFYIFERSAKRGDPRSQYSVGSLYLQGRGTEKNLEEAARWLLLAAEAGIPESQAQIATLYTDGEGVDEDPEEAARWYRKAAVQGHAMAQATLGVMAYQGVGTPHNKIESYMWTSLAAEQGVLEARANLEKLLAHLSEDELTMGNARVRVFKRRQERRAAAREEREDDPLAPPAGTLPE